MKKNKKQIAVLLGFILVFSFVLGQMPARNRTKASDDGEAGQAASSGAVTSGGAVTAAPSFTPAPTEDPYGISKPVRDNKGVTTWDCIYFGNYWQNDTNGDGSADKRDKKEPIRWRVLSVYRDAAFIMADQGLDCLQYNTEEDDVTWETSSLRAWLNDTFYQDAFSEAEQAAISTTSVETMEKNPENGANYKNFTQDNVYLLSLTEVANTAYGFDEDFQKESKTRCSKGTEYARKQGALISAHIGSDDYSGNVWWLLRSSTYNTEGLKAHTVALVGGGGGCGYSRGCAVTDHYSAVRPVLHIDLTSDTWSKAGTITSEGESIEPTPSPTPTPVPTASPTPAPTPDGSGPTGGSEATQKPDTTEEPIPTSTPPAVNTKQKDSSGITYTVTTSSLSKGEVAYTIPKNKKITSAAIPATVKLDGITYKVTSIKANAFKNCKKLKKATIGNNIKTIGKNAFYGCAKLKNITIKTTKLTQKSVGNKAFAKIHKQAVFKVPKKKLSAYKKLLKKKGVSGKKQVIKK